MVWRASLVEEQVRVVFLERWLNLQHHQELYWRISWHLQSPKPRKAVSSARIPPIEKSGLQ